LVHDLWERISEDREEVVAMRAGRGAIGSRAIALSFMAMVILSACTSGTPSELSPSPTLSTTTSPPSPATIARQEALAAYRAMWEDMATAAKTADYRSPLLAQHAAGAALSILVRGLYTDKRTGIVVKGHR
jgi:hypothetical protein